MADEQQISEEQRKFLEQAVLADALLEGVIGQLELSAPDSETVKLVLKQLLKKQAEDFMVTSIWQNMDDRQLEHFNDYLNSIAVIAPDIDKNAMVVDFALRYEPLMRKVYEDLEGFFGDFIESYNQLHRE